MPTPRRRWHWATEDVAEGVCPWPATLRTTWAPLIDLAPTADRHPVKLGNIDYLFNRLATQRSEPAVRSFPLASYLSPPGMRRWVALRAGRPDLGFRRLPLAEGLGVEWRLLQDHVRGFSKLGACTRAWVISLLSQLTLYEDCVRLAEGLDFDPDRTPDAALAYEVGRALQRLDMHHRLPVRLFRAILSGSADPYLRAAAAIQLMVRGGRYEPDAAMAHKALRQGEEILAAERARPRDPFRHAMMCSRLFRAEALVSIVHGSVRTPSLAIDLCRLWHKHGETLADGSLEHLQLLKENHRLLIEASLKLATMRRDDDGTRHASALIQLDGADPDCLAFVGDYWAARGQWRLAASFHLRAMRRGTLRAVISAITAGDLFVRNGQHTAGLRAYHQALSLDGRSITAQDRIRAIAPSDGARERYVVGT